MMISPFLIGLNEITRRGEGKKRRGKEKDRERGGGWRESALCKRDVRFQSLKEEDDCNSRALEAD